MMIGAVMIGAVMEEARCDQIVPLPPLLMSANRSARYMAILPVTAGGVMGMMTLMMMVTVMIRLPMLQPMASTPTGTPTQVPLTTSRERWTSSPLTTSTRDMTVCTLQMAMV
jgi:hypothetical protein